MSVRTLPHALATSALAALLAVTGLLALAPQADAAALLKRRAHGQLQAPVKPGAFHVSQRWHRAHNGLDLAAPRGTKVRSVAAGRVTKVRKWRSSYGKHVVIAHPGGRTVSAHLRGIRVKKGQQVRRGQTIGTVGSTGNSTGPHLHFVLLKGGRPVNPAPYIWR